MKVALQISGEFRTLPHSFEKLKQNLLLAFPFSEVDIFLHTWRQEEDIPGISSHGKGLSLFQPRSYFLENYADRYDLHRVARAYSMFYSIKRANDARKDYERLLEVKYDLVIRYRTDCILNENVFFLIQDFVKEKKSFLCIPKPTHIPNADGPVESDEYGLCDWFAIGTPDAMDIYCSTYDTWIADGLPIVPESMLAFQLYAYGITKQTILKRPFFDMTLVDLEGNVRGGETAVKQSLKSPVGSEER